MAKIYGLFGAMKGKVADVVMVVRNGEQMVRKYQPSVANPSTAAQVSSRAKLKLMSQLSAVMGPYIAMPRKGTVSTRNLFVKENYRTTTFVDNTAKIELLDIKLTKSVVSLPQLRVTRDQNSITVGIDGNNGVDINRVVYMLFRKMTDNTLRAVQSNVVSVPGDNNQYTSVFNPEAATASYVIYAYGVRDNTDAARTVFGNMQAPLAEDVAKLVVVRTLTETDVTLTETRAIESNPE